MRTMTYASYAGIRTKRQRWLKNNLIPLGTMTIFGGKGSEGKSTMALHIAAELSRGTLDGDITEPAGTIILSVEDDAATAEKPRLLAAGADVHHIYRPEVVVHDEHTPDGTVTRFTLPLDIEALRGVIRETGSRLVIVDPAVEAMPGDPNSAKDVRQAYGPLLTLAQQEDISVILIAHFGKGGGRVSDKISGSHAWRDLVRSYWAFAYDEDTGQRVFTQDKSNYSKSLESFTFTLESEWVNLDDGAVEDFGRVGEIVPSDVSVSDIINRDAPSGEQSELDECVEWLLSFLDREPFEFARKDVMKAARAEEFSEATLKRAKSKAGVAHDEARTFPRHTVWRHPRLTDAPRSHDEPTEPTGAESSVYAGQDSQFTVGSSSKTWTDCEPTGLTSTNTPEHPQSVQSAHVDTRVAEARKRRLEVQAQIDAERSTL